MVSGTSYKLLTILYIKKKQMVKIKKLTNYSKLIYI